MLSDGTVEAAVRIIQGKNLCTIAKQLHTGFSTLGLRLKLKVRLRVRYDQNLDRLRRDTVGLYSALYRTRGGYEKNQSD